MNKIFKTLFFLTLLLLPSSIHAETIELLDGQIIEGEIISRDSDSIKIATDYGIEVTYYLDEIKKIGLETPTVVQPIVEVEPEKPEMQAIHNEAPAMPEVVTGEDILDQFKEIRGATTTTEGIKDLRNVAGKVDETLEKGKDMAAHALNRLDIDVPIIQDSAAKAINKAQVFSANTGIPIHILPLFLLGGLVIYAIHIIPMVQIAKRINTGSYWMAWFPIFQYLLWVKMARKPIWWFLLMFVPVVNIFIIAYLWMKIANNLERAQWLGLITFVPVIGLFMLWYLGFSRPIKLKGSPTKSAPGRF